MTEGLRSVEAARDAVLALALPLEPETVPVELAVGRVLAAPAIAAVTLPPWDNSAMDGYAVRSADLTTASAAAPVSLDVIGDAAAGRPWSGGIGPGQAVRIATGAPIVDGADAVIPVERTAFATADGHVGPAEQALAGPPPARVLALESVEPGANVRTLGSDLRSGDVLLGPGQALGPAAIALAAGAGLAELRVHRRPRVAVLSTGDELRPAGGAGGAASIPDANGPGLRALARAAGAVPVSLGIAPDDLDDVTGRLRQAIADGADAVVVSGGVSVGPFDVVRRAFDAVGRVDLWRVAVQPGKPFTFGTAPRPGGGVVLLFGLPGNPVSGFVTFELFVRPAVRRLEGRAEVLRPVDRGVLLDDAAKSRGRRAFLRVTVERDAAGAVRRDGAGRARVRLSRGPAGQGSHVLSALATAEALAVIPETVDRHPAGDPVELWWLDPA
jgi:molybdopterin molybdotransferase